MTLSAKALRLSLQSCGQCSYRLGLGEQARQPRTIPPLMESQSAKMRLPEQREMVATNGSEGLLSQQLPSTVELQLYEQSVAHFLVVNPQEGAQARYRAEEVVRCLVRSFDVDALIAQALLGATLQATQPALTKVTQSEQLPIPPVRETGTPLREGAPTARTRPPHLEEQSGFRRSPPSPVLMHERFLLGKLGA